MAVKAKKEQGEWNNPSLPPLGGGGLVIGNWSLVIMNKIFNLVAIFALVCGMASCKPGETESEPVEPVEEFVIQVTAVTDNSVTLDITPSDKTVTYDYVVIRASEKESFDVGWAINQSYEKHLHGGKLYRGDLKDAQATGLRSETEYVIAVYYVDTNGDRDSKEATFASFKTTEVQVTMTVDISDSNAELIDYTTTGYTYHGEIHYGWKLNSSYYEYDLILQTDNTHSITGTFDISQFIDARVYYDAMSHEIEKGEVIVTGTAPNYDLNGYLIDDQNVRFDLFITVSDYIVGE